MNTKPGQIAALKQAIAHIQLQPARPGARAPLDLAMVRRVVAEEAAKLAGWPPEHIREEHAFMERLGMDVLDRLHLAVTLEDRLVLAPITGWREWQTVADAVAAVVACSTG